ncbi:MAG: gctB, partial [Paenibacillus sp.]|nr:gctB [Paenibacillus sp.]
DELQLICTLSRQLRDREVIAVGNQSPIPAAAALLAKGLHASEATVFILGQPDWPFEGTQEFFDLIQRGGVDVFFLSGAQIDRYGNINLHVIGDYDHPRVRLPGGAGSAVVYLMCRRIFLFKTDHTVKGFPEQLDFVTSVSRSEPSVYRRGQLEGVFTPLGVLKPLGSHGELVLTEVTPGITPEMVHQNTGFHLKVQTSQAQPIPEAAPPTADELRVLRHIVYERLIAIYPDFAARLIETILRRGSP